MNRIVFGCVSLAALFSLNGALAANHRHYNQYATQSTAKPVATYKDHYYKDAAFKDTYKEEPMCFVWTGPYAGINGGYGKGKQHIVQYSNNVGAFPNSTNAINAGAIPGSVAQNPSGMLGGIDAGYNWQGQSAVVGIEADWDWANINGSQTVSTNLAPTYPAYTTRAQQQLQWLFNLRGRAGVLPHPQVLLFVAAGGSYGREKLYGLIRNPGCTGFCATNTTTNNNPGWNAGFGVELALPVNVTVKAEYMYYNLGNMSQRLYDPAKPTSPIWQRIDINGSLVRLGVNYYFM